MSEEIKLYKHFTEQLNQLGKVRRAWFTTFNLDISFFERYILSVLTGMSYRELNTPTSYESINKLLADDGAEPDDEKIEVKVFYDYRALMATGKTKQTAVQLYPIDVKKLTSNNADIKFTYGVFHPKVILLETQSGEYWLMCGSFNLTFGGWSRNRESFFCEKITDTSVARAVGRFFSGIVSSVRGFDLNNPLLVKLNTGRFSNVPCRWRFFSSFEELSFVNELTRNAPHNSLTVWSPYFSDEIDELIETQLVDHFNTIEIIPAKNENQKIRITEKLFLSCLTIPSVKFKQERLPTAAIESFVHAKLWLTPRLMAIGSWNMTKSGMNITNKNKAGNQNVEAGILYSLTPYEYKALTNRYALYALKNPGYLKEEELEQEKKELCEPFALSVDLLLNWEELTIELVSPTYGRLPLEKTDRIVLPGFGKKLVSILENKISIRTHMKSFLTDRFFEIQKNDGTTLFKGYIRERGLADRPAIRFDTIDDFLKCWVDGRPEEKVELHRLAYDTEEENGDELNAQTKKILLNDDRNPWFTSFYAFEQMIDRIQNTNDRSVFRTKNDRMAELKRIGRILPGNLQELREHLDWLLSACRANSQQFKKSPVYLWFLIEKANIVFQFFNQQVEEKEECISKLNNLDIGQLLHQQLSPGTDHEKFLSWLQFIRKKLKINAS